MRVSIAPGSVLLPLLAIGCADHHGPGSTPGGQVLGVVAFESRLLIDLDLPGAVSATTADFDRDGLIDLAAVDADGALVLRRGQGGGSFATSQTLAGPATAFKVHAGDLDGDGALDLVVASRDGGVGIWINDGFGQFAAGTPVGVGTNVTDLALADVDGDGALDLVVIRLGGGGALWFRGVGDGNFLSPITRPASPGGDLVGLSVADLDGDGLAEFVCCDVARDSVVVLPGDGSAEIVIATGLEPASTAIGDLNADGTPEIAVALIGGRRVQVLGRTAARTWTEVDAVLASGQPFDLRVADVDGDGVSELIYTLLDHRAVAVHRVLGQRLEADPWMAPTTGAPVEPQLADLNGDGRLDLFVPAYGGGTANVLFGGEAGFGGGQLHKVAGVVSPDVVHAADIDGDGRAEVIAAAFDSTLLSISAVRIGSGRTRLEPLGGIDLGLPIQNVMPADLDGDGRVDFVVAVAGGIRLVRNVEPAANFLLQLEVVPTTGVLAPGSGPFEIAVGDVDGDGRLDLCAAYHEANKVALLRGTAQPFEFAAPQELAIGGRPLGLAIGDFDADGRQEIAVARLEAATLTVIEVTDSGLEAGSDTAIGAGPFMLRTADFDRDGRTDLVVTELGSAAVRLLVALPSGGFRSLLVDAGIAPTALLTRDLNRDGHPDILVASLIGADFRVLLGDGRGGVAQSIAFPGVNMALSAALADLDDDGLEDLLIGSLSAEAVGLFRNVSRAE